MFVTPIADVAEAIDPELLATGRLNLLGIEPVRERMGERWERRREQVWAHVDRVVGRSLEPGDLFRRVSEVEYLVAFATVSPRVARGRCLQILNDVLVHFLGEADLSELRLSTVAAMSGGVLTAEAITLAEVLTLLSELPQPAPPTAEPLEPAPRAVAGEGWRLVPIRLSSGLRLQVSGWVEPLLHVRASEPVGVRFAREIVAMTGHALTEAEHERLEPQELTELDLATLDLVRHGAAHWGDRPGLILAPLSFNAAAHAGGRSRITLALGDLDPELRARMILTLEGLPESAPASRIAETIGYLQAYARGVVVHVSPVRTRLERLRGARVLGVALTPAGLSGRAGEVFGCLKLLADRSRGIAPEVFALSLPAPELVTLAAAVSAGFYTVRPALAAESLAATG